MSILIKGMEMPKNCYECLVRNQGFSGDGMKCGKTGSVLSWYDGNRKRMDDCPLVPVPPHGKLKDADAIERNLLKMQQAQTGPCAHGVRKSRAVLRDAPTIIPAEEGE